MLISGIILTLLLGFIALHLISPCFSWIEKIGLSFPVGMGLQTILMLITNMVGLKLIPLTVLLAPVLAILVMLVVLYPRRAMLVAHYKNAPRPTLNGYNLVWLLFVAAIVYLEYMNFSKCMYFPTFDRDSLAGFDTIGYVIAQEHTFKGLSLFKESVIPGIHGPGSYIVYTPMVQLSYAFVYLLGAETSKLIPALMFLFFLIAFYGALARVTTKTASAIATLFVLITPELLSFSSMSGTNIIHAISASLGVIYIVLWCKFGEKKDLYLGSLLLALNIWTRTDGVVFICAAFFIVLLDTLKTKQWKNLLPVACSILPALLWALFCRLNNFYVESIAILYPYWEPEKAATIWQGMRKHLMSIPHYGWSYIAFAISFVLNLWFIFKKKDNLPLLIMIILSFVLYMIALYQVDYKWDTINNVLAYSAKRFMFCFIPLMWFYAFSNQWAVWLFRKVDGFLQR